MPYTYEKDKNGRWRTRGQAAGGELMPTAGGSGFGPSKPTPKRKDKPAEKPWWQHFTPAGVANNIKYEVNRARRFNAQPPTGRPVPRAMQRMSPVERQMVIGATVRAGSDAALAAVNLAQRTWGNYNRIKNPLLRTAVGVIPGALPILGLFGPARDPESTAPGKAIVAARRAATAALGGRLPEEMRPEDDLYEAIPAGFAANIALAPAKFLQAGQLVKGAGVAAKAARWGLNTATNEAAANLVTDNTMGGPSSLLKMVGVPVPDALSADPTRDDRVSAGLREIPAAIAFAGGLGGAAALFQQSPHIARAIRDNRTKQDLTRARQRTVANGLQEEDPATGQHSFTQAAQTAPPPPAPAPAPAKPPGSPLEQSAAVLGITPEELAARRGMPAPAAAPTPEPAAPKPIPSIEGDFTTFGKAEPGELPRADPAQDPWQAAPAPEAPAAPKAADAADDVEPVYDPELPEIDHVALALERLDPAVVEQIIQTPGPVLPRIEEALANRQPVTPRPELTSADVRAPTEKLAESQFLSRRDEWANLRDDELLGVFHPEVNPGLFDAIHARTGRSFEELTREDALETLSGMADAGQTVIPSRLAKGIDLMRTGDIGVDANTFQFKLGTDSQGIQRGNSLEGVDRWNTAMEGAVLVWEDPKTGKTWVVNGHNRLAKAKELGIPTVPVKRLLAETAEQARALGALDNIASGGGTAWDAAKFFKTAGITTPEQVQKAGVPLSAESGNGLKGLQLAQLPDNILQAGIDGELSVGKAVALGGSGLSPEKMQSVWDISRTDKDFRGEDSFKELIAYTRDTPTTATQGGRIVQGGIPGLGSAADQDLTKAKLKLARKIASNLADDKNALKGASRNAGILEAKGNNKIDANTSMQTGLETEQLARVFDAMKYTADNEISRLLNEGAAEIAAGSKPDMVARRIQGELAQAAESVVLPKPPEPAAPAPVAAEPPMPKTAKDHEANQMLVLNRAAAQGEVRPSATPIPEPPAPPQIDAAKAARGINAQDVMGGDSQLKFAQQQRQQALDSGDTKAVEAWDKETRKINQGRLGAAQDAQATSQTGLFGVAEYDTSMPLFDQSRLAAEEQRLAAEYLERDTALEQETARAEREAMGYHDMTFDQKKAEAGVAEGWEAAEPAPVPAPPQRFFHGSAGEFSLDRGGEFGGDGMNIYGDGLYTTDSLNVAGKYQKKNKSRGAEINGVTYEVVGKGPTKFFDLDKPASSKTLDKLRKQGGYAAMRQLIGDAIDELGDNPSLGEVFDEMRAGSRALEIPAYELQEMWHGFALELEKDGYGGFTHQGGRLTGRGKELHQVRIYWNPAESVEIYKLDSGGNRIGVTDAASAPAAATAPRVIEIPAAADKKLNPNSVEATAEILAKWANAGFITADTSPIKSMDQAMELVRAKNRQLWSENIPGIDLDKANDDLMMGRNSQAVQDVSNAYRQFYGVKMPGGEGQGGSVSPMLAAKANGPAMSRERNQLIRTAVKLLDSDLPFEEKSRILESSLARRRAGHPGIDMLGGVFTLGKTGAIKKIEQDVIDFVDKMTGGGRSAGEDKVPLGIEVADHVFVRDVFAGYGGDEPAVGRAEGALVSAVYTDANALLLIARSDVTKTGGIANMAQTGAHEGIHWLQMRRMTQTQIEDLSSDEAISWFQREAAKSYDDYKGLTNTELMAWGSQRYVAASLLDNMAALYRREGKEKAASLLEKSRRQHLGEYGKAPTRVSEALKPVVELFERFKNYMLGAGFKLNKELSASELSLLADFAIGVLGDGGSSRIARLIYPDRVDAPPPAAVKDFLEAAYRGEIGKQMLLRPMKMSDAAGVKWSQRLPLLSDTPPDLAGQNFQALSVVLRQVDDGKLKGVSKRALDAAEKGDHTLALAEATDYASRRMAEIDNRIEGIKQRAIEEGC